MTFRADLTAAALAFAPLKSLVDRRISWRLRVQGEGLPALVLTLVSSPEGYTMRQRMGFTGHLIQFDAWAENGEDADALETVIRAFADTLTAAPFAGAFIENARDGLADDEAPQPTGATELSRTSIDVRIWHRET